MVYHLVSDSVLSLIKAVLVPFASLRFMMGMILMVMLGLAFSPQKLLAKEPISSIPPAPPSSLSLNVTEAVSLFLKQNLDLLMTKYGIDDAKGLAITAKLFPNPVLSLFGGAAFTQQQTFKGTRYLTPQIEQMFLLAGKRGYRIESAGYGIQAAEATFTDAIRELTLALKDAYFQVQLASRRLDLAKDNQERFHRILTIGELRFKKGFIAEVDLIRLRL